MVYFKFKNIVSFCDNTSAVECNYRGITSTSLPGARLLRFLSLRKQERKSSSLTPNEHSGKRQCNVRHTITGIQGWKCFIGTKKYNILLQLVFPSPPESSIEGVYDTCKFIIACDLMFAWILISDGFTAQTARTRGKYWRPWKNYCK